MPSRRPIARDPQQTLAAVRELRAAADRAVRLSNQLLSLARAEPGEQAARFVNVDMAALAFDTGAEWVPRALTFHVDLGFQRLDDPEQRPSVDGARQSRAAARSDRQSAG